MIVTCRKCGAPTEAFNKNKRFCDACRKVRAREAVRRWQKHGPRRGPNMGFCEDCSTVIEGNSRLRFCRPCRKARISAKDARYRQTHKDHRREWQRQYRSTPGFRERRKSWARRSGPSRTYQKMKALVEACKQLGLVTEDDFR
jgi:hypothetical protein